MLDLQEKLGSYRFPVPLMQRHPHPCRPRWCLHQRRANPMTPPSHRPAQHVQESRLSFMSAVAVPGRPLAIHDFPEWIARRAYLPAACLFKTCRKHYLPQRFQRKGTYSPRRASLRKATVFVCLCAASMRFLSHDLPQFPQANTSLGAYTTGEDNATRTLAWQAAKANRVLCTPAR